MKRYYRHKAREFAPQVRRILQRTKATCKARETECLKNTQGENLTSIFQHVDSVGLLGLKSDLDLILLLDDSIRRYKKYRLHLPKCNWLTLPCG
ncbi:MAG: hypothetical protein ACI9LE_000405 [Paraglaciecola sp.]|jgi:hypothetical protein